MMRFTELLPQIKDFQEMKSGGTQIVGILADYMVILSYSCDKIWKYIELQVPREKKIKEHHYTSEVR